MTLAAIEGHRALAELAQRFDAHANQIAEWRRQPAAHAAEAFADAAPSQAQIDVKALHATIGQQALMLGFLSNALGREPVRAARDDRPDAPALG